MIRYKAFVGQQLVAHIEMGIDNDLNREVAVTVFSQAVHTHIATNSQSGTFGVPRSVTVLTERSE